jgi:hypothetical protein
MSFTLYNNIYGGNLEIEQNFIFNREEVRRKLLERNPVQKFRYLKRKINEIHSQIIYKDPTNNYENMVPNDKTNEKEYFLIEELNKLRDYFNYLLFEINELIDFDESSEIAKEYLERIENIENIEEANQNKPKLKLGYWQDNIFIWKLNEQWLADVIWLLIKDKKFDYTDTDRSIAKTVNQKFKIADKYIKVKDFTTYISRAKKKKKMPFQDDIYYIKEFIYGIIAGKITQDNSHEF